MSYRMQSFFNLKKPDSFIEGEIAENGSAEQAVEAASQSFDRWKKTPPQERSRILRKVGDIMLDHRVRLANIMTGEMGKTRKDGLAEVAYSSGFFHWFSGEAERLYNSQLRSPDGDKTIHYLKAPVGPCGLITPWNFPLAMPARKIAAALAAGCSLVLKPAAECPMSALFTAFACREAGIPPGVVNVILGDAKTVGETLLDSPKIKKISFTGSTEVGIYLYERSAKTLKKLSLELGGNAPVIIFDDADIDLAVEQAVIAKFRNNGQSCVAANRIFVQESVHDAFAEKFTAAVKKLKVGDPADPETDLTDTLHSSVLEKVPKHIEDALKNGAKALLKGSRPFEPTILSEAAPEMLICREETFGPAVPLIRFSEESDAFGMANDTPYGLASYLFTQSLKRARRAMDELQFGIIGINDGLPSSPSLSFGGVKKSGLGREGGPAGIDEYLVEKCVSLRSWQAEPQPQAQSGR